MNESNRQSVDLAERDNHTLPSWIYNDARFSQLERDELLSKTWHLACHVSEIAQPGDYITLKYLGERIAVARLQDGNVTAFHNTCRHRAHQVITGESGNCKRVHVCPYHGWTYAQDGAIRGIPGGSEEDLKQVGHGLINVDFEVCLGFVWIRLKAEGPSMAERLAPLAGLLQAFRIEEMLANDDLGVESHAVDWKNMMDNYLEGYHVAVGHPGLNQLVEPEYDVTVDVENGTVFATHLLKEHPAGGSDAFTYLSVRPDVEHLPGDHGRRWSYLSIFPNVNIGLMPEGVDYFVFNPDGPGRATFRTRSLSLPNPSPALKAAVEATGRIWQEVQEEDNQLTESVQRGFEGSAYPYGYLSPRETGVRAFRDWMRQRLPVVREEVRPAADIVRLV
jgi:phenylpropionate dioxygenase-like ring-hydroxylating dioxygenase large terminal subunit